MNSEWGEYELGDIGKIVTGKTPPSKISDLFGSEIPFVTPSDMDNRKWIDLTGRYLSQKGADLLRTNKVPSKAVAVSCIGSDMGKARLLKRESVTNQQINTIVVDMKKFDPEFIYYNLLVRQEELKHIASGSATPILSKSHFSKIKIKCPNLSTQKKCARVLSIIDDKISLLHETNSTLESIAQALFKSWFIDFDPVHAKAEGREPEGMDAETAALFPDSFEESELGFIPKGWRVGILDDIAKTVGGQKQAKDFNSDVNYVGLEHMPRNSLGLFEWSTAEGLASAKSCFALGDILFGKLRPYFHKVVIAPFDGVCSTDILVCQSKKISFYSIVLMHLFSNSLINYASRLSNGAKMPRINWKDLAKYPIILPPEQVAESFSISIQPLLDRMKENTQQAKVLASLRDILLPRLISGQLCLSKEEAKVTQYESY